MKLFVPNFPNDHNKALKIQAAREDISKRTLIIRLIKQAMKREGIKVQ